MFHSDRGSQGAFNRSSQNSIVDQFLGTRLRTKLASSSRALSEALPPTYSGQWLLLKQVPPHKSLFHTAAGKSAAGGTADYSPSRRP
jgi:hypothetical protein